MKHWDAKTKCPGCGREIELDRGYDGEGGVGYCCEYSFEWSLEWVVEIRANNPTPHTI